MERPIQVRFPVAEIVADTYDIWATKLYKRLVDAGIPAMPDGKVSHGTLWRINDPTDFGAVIYEWRPELHR